MLRRPPDMDEARRAMVEEQLRSRGIRNHRVLDAMGRVPREDFLPSTLARAAYDDRAVPIDEGQTLSQPYMVAAMTEALEPGPTDRVLEIGTGSGYQAAVLSLLVSEVFSLERIASLAEGARKRLNDLGYSNVRVRTGDGSLGWPEEAPFDGIIVTAAAPEPPRSLLSQLSEVGGRLVVPVGTRTEQDLLRVRREGDELETDTLLGCRFVPLLGEEGW